MEALCLWSCHVITNGCLSGGLSSPWSREPFLIKSRPYSPLGPRVLPRKPALPSAGIQSTGAAVQKCSLVKGLLRRGVGVRGAGTGGCEVSESCSTHSSQGCLLGTASYHSMREFLWNECSPRMLSVHPTASVPADPRAPSLWGV